MLAGRYQCLGEIAAWQMSVLGMMFSEKAKPIPNPWNTARIRNDAAEKESRAGFMLLGLGLKQHASQIRRP